MGASLMQQCRVREEGFRIVNLCRQGKKPGVGNDSRLMVPAKEGAANSVPAAAVIRRPLALFGIIGRKAGVGGLASQM